MARYSVQPRDQIFVKGYVFLSFDKNMGKNFGKNISNSLSGKYSPGMLAEHQKRLNHAKTSATDALKTSSKSVIQKTAEATGDFMVIKLLIELKKFQKIHNKMIQRMIKKYLKKDVYLQKKDKKSLMN